MNMTPAFKWNSPQNYSSWWDEMNLTFGGRLHNIGKTDIGIFSSIIQYIELILLFESKPSFKGWTICKKKKQQKKKLESCYCFWPIQYDNIIIK